VASIKIPGVPVHRAEAAARVQRLRALIPDTVTIGVSGDALAATGLNAGCDAWYSVLAGLFPSACLAITRAAAAGDAATADALSQRLEPLWALFRRHGSVRVVSAAAEQLGLVRSPNLPLPLRGLDQDARDQLAAVLGDLELTA
jgi:4-hydroxy-tetrahydrodipicolinate synthase